MTKKTVSGQEPHHDSFPDGELKLTDFFTLPSRAILAPMEGIMSGNAFFHAASSLGLIDSWMPPFIGASRDCPPKCGTLRKRYQVFLESGLPFTLQLLGHDEETLLQAAHNAWKAGIRSLNLNCGCPSPTVLSSGSGGALLKGKDKIRSLLQTLRKGVPHMAVSIKLRAAFEREEESGELFHAVREGDPHWIILHYRTVTEGYQPMPKETALRRLQKARRIWEGIPFFANGDILHAEDAYLYRRETGCDGVAAARGLLRNPFLLNEIRCKGDPRDLRREFLKKLTENLTPRQKKFYGMECIRMIYGRDSEEFRKALQLHRSGIE